MGENEEGASLVFNRIILEKLLPVLKSPPLLVKERGIKGVRFKKINEGGGNGFIRGASAPL